MTEKTIKNTDLDETNSINSDDEKGVDSIKDLLSGINKVIDKSNKSNKSKKNDKSKKNKEVIIEENDSDDDSDEDTDDSDEKIEDIELDEEDSENEDSDEDEDDDDDDDCCDDDIFDTSAMTLAALFQETFYSSEGESVADIFAGIRDELHKMNHNMKKNYKK